MISTRLKQALAARGMKQVDLARAANVTDRTISHYARGQRCKYMECFKAVCIALDVSADYLLGLSDKMERKVKQMDRTVQLLTDMWNKLQNECHDVVTEENYDALKKAIAALEQQPCEDATLKDIFCMGCEYKEQEQSEDAISRQAAIGIIQNWLDFDTGYSWGEKNVMLCAIDELKGLPSVSAEKTGRWIYDRRRDWYGECKYECSECGMGSDVNFPYCMRCGAKMGVEE